MTIAFVSERRRAHALQEFRNSNHLQEVQFDRRKIDIREVSFTQQYQPSRITGLSRLLTYLTAVGAGIAIGALVIWLLKQTEPLTLVSFFANYQWHRFYRVIPG